ncbi:hypothetical protein ACFV1C_02660 [Streptomyces sp. NPDC059605]|uniref:hypothetical protein n=1 Tax=unclassified Streptomyces TaxID=2593676 RepID=UPI0036C3957D
MSNEQNQDSGQPAAAPAPAPPAPQQDFVAAFTNQAMIGTEKKSDTRPTANTAVRPQGNTETR